MTTEILLKVALNTITLNNISFQNYLAFHLFLLQVYPVKVIPETDLTY